jgi:ribosomal peptide maturation radical SAM protein 1
MKIALICMPFAPFNYPAIGISLLQAELRREGIGCDNYYLNLPFASRIGCRSYDELGVSSPMISLAGEWLFAHELFGANPQSDRAYIDKILRKEFASHFPARAVRRLIELREGVGDFLNDCLNRVPWADYGVVGFTSSFQQNVASLALAKRVKRAFPEKKLVFGGANCEGEMGIELHRQFPFVDYVCSGEGDRAFPELVRRLAAGGDTGEVAGIISRKNKETVVPRDVISPVFDLDDLPYPCYDDYFAQLGQVHLNRKFVPYVPFETSRGCWWGQKMHCTFCGLNSGSMTYRSKNAVRALKELTYLGKTYGKKIVNVDTILDLNYLDSFFPELIARKQKFSFYFETKVNLTKEQIKLLRDAGVRDIQPGIESLSTAILKLMKKGCSLLQNVQFLKWARQFRMEVMWNLLYGLPGELAADYAEMAKFIPHLSHLDPPVTCGKMRLDRFSPYFMRASDFGLTQVRAHDSYSYVYPFEQEALSRLAYFFGFHYPQEATVEDYVRPVKKKLNAWRLAGHRGKLRGIIRKHTLTIVDTRKKHQKIITTLPEPLRTAYIFCDQIRPLAGVEAHLTSCLPRVNLADSWLKQALDDLVSRGLMLKEGKSYLSLAILPGFPMEARRQVTPEMMPTAPPQSLLQIDNSCEVKAGF